MHKSALARCTITSEALRRRKQRERDNTTRPRLADVTQRASFADLGLAAGGEALGGRHLNLSMNPNQVAVKAETAAAADFAAETLGNAGTIAR